MDEIKGYTFWGVFGFGAHLLDKITAEDFRDPDTGEYDEETFLDMVEAADDDMLDFIAGEFVGIAGSKSNDYDFFYVKDYFGNIPFIYNGVLRRYNPGTKNAVDYLYYIDDALPEDSANYKKIYDFLEPLHLL